MLLESEKSEEYDDRGKRKREKVLQLEERLRGHVKGQDYALRRIAEAIQVSRAGLRTGERPVAVFLLLGPTVYIFMYLIVFKWYWYVNGIGV